MPSFQYQHPKLYDFAIRLTHRPKVISEFNKQVGKNVSVFDIAAGFGRMAKYIDKSNTYSGIDLNVVSLDYAKKQNLNVLSGDIFNPKAYVKSDVLVLVDVVHHISLNKLSELFDLVFSNAKERVIIMEPSFVNLEDKYGIFGKFFDNILMKLDDDGVNNITHWFSEKEYHELISNRFGSQFGKYFTVKTKKVGAYYIITYVRN